MADVIPDRMTHDHIGPALDAIIAANPDKFAQAQKKPSLRPWFCGQVARALGGRLNPSVLKEEVNRRFEPKAAMAIRKRNEG